eukprot:TRINITY_DN11412_c0_g1_i7.p1 TRINITY_DN11412_c0_g1~~TRINITY_DN11412_c0_g1_i7.p1  ORF type:complete len:333 (-),score=78.43 TRINITY_DN11412_c0_g1_i7:153-1016(-)
MEGLLLKKGGGAFHSWKQMWFSLQDGNLLYYKKQGEACKGTIVIAGAKIEGAVVSGKYVINITVEGSSSPKMFSAKTHALQQEWLTSLQAHTTRDPSIVKISPAPKVKKGAKYAIENAAASSAVGKAIIKKLVQKDFIQAVDSFENFLRKYKNDAIATEFRRNIEKSLVKHALLLHNKRLDAAAEKEMIRHHLRIAQLVIDYYQMPSIFDIDIMMEALTQKRAFFERNIAPQLSPKNAALAARVFDVIVDQELITELFQKGKWAELGDIAGVMKVHPATRSRVGLKP